MDGDQDVTIDAEGCKTPGAVYTLPRVTTDEYNSFGDRRQVTFARCAIQTFFIVGVMGCGARSGLGKNTHHEMVPNTGGSDSAEHSVTPADEPSATTAATTVLSADDTTASASSTTSSTETLVPLPEECRLAPIDPELRQERFVVLGDVVEQDYLPPEDERWNWVSQDVAADSWPYPARALWPIAATLPLPEDSDFELTAIGGVSQDDWFVVGRLEDSPLLLHFTDGEWAVESPALLAALPTASSANSISVLPDGRVWLTAPEGLAFSTGFGDWQPVPVPQVVHPLGAVWMNEQGFGVVAGGTVASTPNAGERWELETRQLGFVAPGLAYSRSFVRLAGHGSEVAVVGAYGHSLSRDNAGWQADTLLAADAAFTSAGRFVTTRNPSNGLFHQQTSGSGTWQIYPLTSGGGLSRVSASPSGDVFAGGSLFAVLHRFPDGTLELLPSSVNDLRDFHSVAGRLYALGETTLWQYELGLERETSGAARAAAIDPDLLDVVPSANTVWGQSAAPNFTPLECVDFVLTRSGAPVWQGQLEAEPPKARYGSCAENSERAYSETAFGFTAPTTGTYRITLTALSASSNGASPLRLALRNGCEGWLIWGSGSRASGPSVDIGLEGGQVLLIEVYATEMLTAAVPFELSIY